MLRTPPRRRPAIVAFGTTTGAPAQCGSSVTRCTVRCVSSDPRTQRAIDALRGVFAGAGYADGLIEGGAISEDYAHDEALGADATMPIAVVRPRTTADVAEV